MEASVLASLTVSSLLWTGAHDTEPNWKGFGKMKGGKYVGVHNSTFSVLVLLLLLGGRSCHLSLILNFEYLKART